MDDGFKKPEDVGAKETDRDLEHAANSDEKDNELVAVTTAASQRLPFSKARCIALVATVAAAPFLTVRFQAARHRSMTLIRDRPSTFKLQLLRFPQLVLRSTFPRVDSNGLSQLTILHLVAFS
jgi:hypothetical protein